jgi:hypothetical protein
MTEDQKAKDRVHYMNNDNLKLIASGSVKDDLVTPEMAKEEYDRRVEMTTQSLAKHVMDVWEERSPLEYLNESGHKILPP